MIEPLPKNQIPDRNAINTKFNINTHTLNAKSINNSQKILNGY